MPLRPEIQRPLRWLMLLRLVVATTLLVSAFVIELAFRPAVTLKPFYILTGVTYLLSLGYALLFRRFRERPGFAAVQLVGDIGLTTGVVYVTGGIASAFSFLYVLSVLSASILLYRRGAFLAASTAWIAYAVLVLLQYHGLAAIHPGPEGALGPVTLKRVSYALVAHLLGFQAVGLLGSALSERVRETDRELAQRREDLADLQALHRNIIDSIHSGIVTTDVEGRITFLNLAAERMTGHRVSDQAGRSLAGFLGESDRFLERVESTPARGLPLRLEKPFRTARGELLHLGMAVSALHDRDGARRGFIVIFRDLTERKALEEELRLADRMSVLGRMAASMAHELRNPLASMFGAVQLLRKDLKLTTDQDELMQVVLDESRRLDQTIRDFLLFARPSPFHAEDADLAQVLRDSLVLLRHSAELRSDHTIRTEFAPESVPYRFDVNLMKQIFWNLAKNSLKAMPSGGELRIQIAQGPGGGPEIVFADEGVGMEADEVQRFFQPFETAFPDGTGLGLAIVYRNVQEHRGRLDVRSAPGAGTRFTIRLPAVPAAAEAQA